MTTDRSNPRFLALLDEVRAVHVAKAAGYSGANTDTWANFREAEAWGLTPLQGCLVRMGDKYRRVQNLRRNPANDQVGESIRDTLMDLANYALIAVCLLEEEQVVLIDSPWLDIADVRAMEGLGQDDPAAPWNAGGASS